MTTKTKEIPQGRIVQPGGLSKSLIKTINASVKSAAVATTCEWLVSEGYASDLAHAVSCLNRPSTNRGTT